MTTTNHDICSFTRVGILSINHYRLIFGFKRKLAAILSADVEGYSRLMDDDEEATVCTLTAYRTAIADLVQQFRGRVVDTPGDNILAEFTSVVDAVNCAVEIQRDLAERNTELPYNRQMQFRIGINLGDVIEEDISSLSKTDQLFVISRNSSFTYKGKPVKVRQVAEELGVRYVLEGSVRKSEDRVRITAQLIDATKGHHLWSEIRHYGFLANRNRRTNLKVIRKLLKLQASFEEMMLQLTGIDITTCPCCNKGKMQIAGRNTQLPSTSTQ